MKSTSNLKVIVLAGLIAVAIPSFADTTTPSLALKGVVAPAMSLSVVGTAAATDLPMLAGATNVKIATATEFCNNHNGYTVWLHSTNGGKLLGQTQPEISPDVILYTITYGTDSNNTFAPTTIDQKFATILSRTGVAGSTKDVGITFNSSPYLIADEYSDTLYFSIVKN